MTGSLFNITKLIKVSIIAVLALMLNIGNFEFAKADDGSGWAMGGTGLIVSGTNQSLLGSLFGSKKMKEAGDATVNAGVEMFSDTEVVNAGGCSAAYYRAQHTRGCWSCLVVERLASAFLQVAKNGLPITQKAGVLILVLGSILWMLMWGLKNVSSFSEVQAVNILNDLFKFSFKVMLAYWFIVLSSSAISQYFIRPIMSVGAIIGQNMWGEEVKEQTVPWDDLSDVDITEEVQRAEEKREEEILAAQQSVNQAEIDTEQAEELKARTDRDNASKSEIPPFQIPGCNGSITSFPGCRVPPPTNGQTNCGSFSHMGLDVGAPEGSPIWAVAGGDIVYSQSKSWGNMAKITTKHKSATWTHLYAHMNQADWEKYKSYHATKGYKVARGEIIGGVGNTGQSGGNHLHLEVILNGTVGGKNYSNVVVEPVSLAEGRVVVRGKKSGSPTGAVDKSSCTCGQNGNPGCSYHSDWKPVSNASAAEKRNNKSCKGFNSQDPQTQLKKGSSFPTGGITNPGITPESIAEADSRGYSATSLSFYSSPSIPEINYTGPTNIVPKSIMNSMLGALRVITNTTAENMVLGKMVMCYSTLENGGALSIFGMKIPNIFKWIQGLVMLVLGFLLTAAIGYYFMDISFKLGFSVLAMPIVAGLWPFKKTEDKIKVVLSIMFRASASFAFMALTTSFGMALVSETLSGLDVLYDKIEKISSSSSQAELDELNKYIDETLAIFSSTFLLMCFSMYYFYTLVSEGTDKFTNKFFPDQTFGDANPMHQNATAATSKMYNLAKSVTGVNLLKDGIKHQMGSKIKSAGNKLGSAVGAKASGFVNKMRGKNNNAGGGGA